MASTLRLSSPALLGAAGDPAPYTITREEDRLRFTGRLGTADAARIWRELRRATDNVSGGRLRLDLGEVETVDGSVMALMTALRADLMERGVEVEVEGARPSVQPLVELYGADAPTRSRKRRRAEGFVEQVGRATAGVFAELAAVISFLGEMVVALAGLVRHPRSGHWKEVPSLIEKTGADALPIAALINFLMGFVMAYQSSRQLRTYGANLYVADLVGISVTRELAPLMTAIIVCGRSGAAFAAEIGSMKVSEEVDALRTLGLRPFAWLVVPRAIALLVIVPALTILGDVIGTLGGAVVGMTSLGVGFRAYMTEIQVSVQMWDVAHGMVKSVVFALTIVLVACQQGFAASGGAEGVGKRTTSTVVSCLFLLVVLDAVITTLFRAIGH